MSVESLPVVKHALSEDPEAYCRIGSSTRTSPSAILNRQHSPFFGISLTNSFFRKADNIRRYLMWGAAITPKDYVPVVIVDDIHAVNFRVTELYREILAAIDGGYLKAEWTAQRDARKSGDKMVQIISETVESLPSRTQERIRLLRWADLVKLSASKYYPNLDFLMERYQIMRGNFYDRVIQITKGIALKSGETMSKEELRSVGEYVVHEIAMIVGGVDICRDGITENFDLSPYPCIPEMQALISDIEMGREGLELLQKRLQFSNRLCSVALLPIDNGM